MKVVAFNCSPHRDGNTAHMIKTVLSELESEGIATEFIQIGGKEIHGCKACSACRKNHDLMCSQKDDCINDCIEKMISADGVIIGSPTYFADLTPEAKALIDRAGYVLRSNGNPMRRKVGTPVVAVRRAGSIHVIDSITHFFTINDMFVVPSSYWNMSLAPAPGDYENDTEGVATMKNLGQNMAWLLKRLE
ncbi:MAG: flavodoxin family protein [Candidatus Methanomethylophilaceae archaeon]